MLGGGSIRAVAHRSVDPVGDRAVADQRDIVLGALEVRDQNHPRRRHGNPTKNMWYHATEVAERALRADEVLDEEAEGLGRRRGWCFLLLRGCGRIDGVLTMVHQCNMNKAARVFCSRMPSEIPIDMAMSEAEMEYWSGKGAHVKLSVIRG